MTIKSRVREIGQGLTEYIIIVTLIAISALAVYNLFGKHAHEQISGKATEVTITHPHPVVLQTGLEIQTASNLGMYQPESRQ